MKPPLATRKAACQMAVLPEPTWLFEKVLDQRDNWLPSLLFANKPDLELYVPLLSKNAVSNNESETIVLLPVRKELLKPLDVITGTRTTA